MRYKAELFDKLQYAFEETKFNDHQLHSVIQFEHKIEIEVLKRAVELLYEVCPLLSCVYVHNNGDGYWEKKANVESVEKAAIEAIFKIADDETDFNLFTVSKTDATKGPQLKFCLYRAIQDSLSIIMNHMICDAAGFKECLYLLSSFYSSLIEDSNFAPEFIIDGDRSIKGVMSQICFLDKLKALFLQNKDSNQKSFYRLPMSIDQNVEPFILTHELSEERYHLVREFSKNHQVTLNDIVLTAYYRVIAKMLNAEGKPLNIPIMIDMRKYLKEKNPQFLTNISSTLITNITVSDGEPFEMTLRKVSQEMNLKKSNQIGLNGFVKLSLLQKVLSNVKSYSMTKNNLINPNIFMTNIGILYSEKLDFKGAPITNVFMCGSIKYRPHFQVALTSFKNKMTFSSNLYGSIEDQQMVLNFFELLDQELPK